MIFFFQLSISRAKDLQKIKLFPIQADHPQQLELVIWYKKAFWFSFKEPFYEKKKMHDHPNFFLEVGFFVFQPLWGAFVCKNAHLMPCKLGILC